MNALKLMIMGFICLTLTINTQGQFLEKLSKKAQKKVENEAEKRTEKRVNKGIDNVFDKTEEEIDNNVKDKNGRGSEESETGSKGQAYEVTNEEPAPQYPSHSQRQEQTQDEPKAVLTWSKYDFVPGAEIIFEDDQQNELNGEFPSKWDLEGGVVENANLDGNNVIFISTMRANLNRQGIVPLIENSRNDYLTDEFTIEFDAYFQYKASSVNNYRVLFYDAKNQKNKSDLKDFSALDITQYTARLGSSIGSYPKSGHSHSSPYNVTNPGWRHIAISFNKRALKVYFDDARILNIPNLGFNPSGLTLLFTADENTKGYIKNVRIAKGAVPLYNKVLTDGKFVTTGIKFDVNKATIKPESMGTINYVVKMMNDNPGWIFSVEGHTDSDGAESLNQSLSEKRAEAICDELIKLGINANRLTSKGWGESKPMANNNSPEGKAQNRRVEFKKQ